MLPGCRHQGMQAWHPMPLTQACVCRHQTAQHSAHVWQLDQCNGSAKHTCEKHWSAC